jgi:hypothetical protein
MSNDYENDPQFIAWAKRVKEELVPKIDSSACTISLVPEGEVDVKFAVELGLSIMLDKPIIVVVRPGTKVPDKLALVAADIVEVKNWEDIVGVSLSISEAIGRLIDRKS